MIVCSCNVISDRQIRDAVSDTQTTVRTAGQVYRCLGCSAQCGRCARTIRKLIDDVNASVAARPCGACPRECPAAPHGHEHAHHEHAHHEHERGAHAHHGHAHAVAAE